MVPLPQPRFFGSDVNYRDSFASSLAPTTVTPALPRTPSIQGSLAPIAPVATTSAADAGAEPKGDAGSLHGEKIAPVDGAERDAEQGTKSRKRLYIIGAIAAIIILVIVIVVPLTTRKKHSPSNNSSSGSGSGSGSGNGNGNGNSGPNNVFVGRDGATVTKEDGSTFTYTNKFGGYFIVDPANPFNDGARAQEWNPALNETFRYGVDKIRGVNIGGWLNTEPFISPALYEKYLDADPRAIDEWTLSAAMRADTSAGGGIQQLEQHYATFITEEDFAQIAAAGLNHVRIPLPFWAIETMGNEPFLKGTAWKYFLKAIEWARKYGIRINLDLHAVPGSQNGFNHSGQHGPINFLNGVMGVANAQRALDHIRILTEFISQPQYANVVTMFSILNEPGQSTIGRDSIDSFNLQVHDMVRNITGRGEGKGPYIIYGNGFTPLSEWAGYMPGADRIVIDWHPYFSFVDSDHSPLSSQVSKPCRSWGAAMNNSLEAFGLSVAGEWSNGFNDCGWYLNGVGSGSRWEGSLASAGGGGGGSCDEWDEWESWDDSTKKNLREFALSSMDALQNWFFWTWKIGPSPANKNKIRAPLWSYQLGLQNGWMPLDPRESVGKCADHGIDSPFDGPLKPTQTGGGAAGTISPSFTRAHGQWPPAQIAGAGAPDDLPSYTPTGILVTLPVPTPTPMAASAGGPVVAPTADPGSGWYKDLGDKAYVPIAGCKYPDAWDAVNAGVPPKCDGSAVKKRAGYAYPPVEPRATGVVRR
jgi:aryl-phospho-beta-D-glucosidase BglC (GH1 family)